MSDFTLLPANAAANGFINGDCHHSDECTEKFCDIHKDIADSSRHIDGSVVEASINNLKGQTDIIKDVSTNSRYLSDKICDSTSGLKSDICHSTSSVISNVHSEADQTRAAADRNGIETRGVIQSYGDHNRDAVEALSKENAMFHKDAALNSQKCCCETQKIVLETTSALKQQEATHSAEMKMLQENARIELLRQADTNRLILERQAADYHGDAKLQACENTCKLEKDIELSKNALQLQAADYYAKSELRDTKQHCELQKQICDCCCDVKELIREQTCGVEKLFQNQENQRLRDELNKSQMAAMEARIKPFPYAQCVSLKPCCCDNDCGSNHGNHGHGNS